MLHASCFMLHASCFIKKGFRSAALIGVASLSLAACGGGDSTVQTAPVTRIPPDNQDPDPDCTAVPRPAGCPDREPVVPMPLDGLGDSFKTGAAVALREVADTTKVHLTGEYGGDHPRSGGLAVHGLQIRLPLDKEEGVNDFTDTKVAKVVPNASAGSMSYSFGLYTPADDLADGTVRSVFSTGNEQISTDPFSVKHKIFSIEDKDAFTKIESIASQFGEGWDYSILKASVPSIKDGEKDSTLYAELWTDRASTSANDYMVGGWWLLAPNNPAGDYRFGTLAQVKNYYIRSGTGSIKSTVEGPATYKGHAAGLHVSSENGMVSIQRLLGKVTLNADFGNSTDAGTISGAIDDLTLDGVSVDGQLLLLKAPYGDGSIMSSLRPIKSLVNLLNPKSSAGNIKGTNYYGDWAGTFQGDSSGTDQPTGIVGVVGGSGGGNSFVASFGAKKVMDEE